MYRVVSSSTKIVSRGKATRIFVHPVTTPAIREQSNPPSKQVRNAVRDFLRESGLKGTLSWSRTAGCSCGCRPGYVLEGARGEVIDVMVAHAH